MQYASAHHNLLVDPLIRVRRLGGAIDTLSLPELYASLAVDGVAVFPALRPHQRHAWHAFLAQLAVIAMHRGDATEFPETASEWRTLLRALTRAFAHDQPWHLVGGEPAQPAFMQCPAPRGLEPYRTLKATPDDLDLLITSKNHEQKRSIAVRSATDDWIFALIDVQTMSGFSGPGNYGVARMNGGLSSRPCLGFAPAGRGPGAHLVHDVRRMLAGRGALVERHAFAPDSGLALLWLHPWDGTDAVSLRMLDPLFHRGLPAGPARRGRWSRRGAHGRGEDVQDRQQGGARRCRGFLGAGPRRGWQGPVDLRSQFSIRPADRPAHRRPARAGTEREHGRESAVAAGGAGRGRRSR